MTEKKDILFLYILIIVDILILLHSKIIVQSVIISLKVFLYTVLPSLFPTMLIGSMIVKKGAYKIIPKNIKKIFNKLFNFNDAHISIFIMSFICGSPSNGLFINEYLKNNLITEKEAENLLCVTHFINPLFIISISKKVLGNEKYGFLAIALLLISNLIKALVLKNNFKSKNKTIEEQNVKTINVIINSVKESVNALLVIFGIITLFSMLSTLFTEVFNCNLYINFFLNSILEVTGGILKLSYLNINTFIKFCIFYYLISFGGFSIIMQNISMIKNKKIKYLKYFISRIV